MPIFYFMPKLINLVGQVFDKLTVIESELKYNDDKRRMWLCRCDCGNTVWKTRKALLKSPENFCGFISHSTKECTKCKVDKPKSEYHKCAANPIGIQTVCKECKKNEYLENTDFNKQKYIEMMSDPERKKRKYETNDVSRKKIKNIEREKKTKLEYYKRPEVIERRKEIHRIRKATDLQYNIKKRLRWRVRDVVKKQLKNKKFKYNSAIDLLGCDVEYLIKHLESTFTEGMSWGRLPELHIDHRRPCNTYDLTDPEQQKECFSYKNMQMLWAEDNLKKGKREIS